MPAEGLMWIGLGEHISRLIFAVNCIDGDVALVNIVPEVVVLNVDMIGAWADLGYSCTLNCTAVVLKYSAMHSWLGAAKTKA